MVVRCARALMCIFLCCLSQARCADENEWRKRVIYQILTDRFGPEGTAPSEPCDNLRTWCGGTFQGIIQRLDYIKNLGADAIWISPMVLNTEGGYHGYWAQDIYQVEPHFGSKEDLLDLVEACHQNDMFLMLDVVPNHMGYTPGCDWNPCEPEKLVNVSGFAPFNDIEHYHELCAIEDFNNQTEVEICRLANLPDLNQTVPYVHHTLLNWISDTTMEYGFDGYRIDTTRHISLEFWPGYQQAAGAYTLGEVAVDDVKYTAQYQGPLISVLNYPLYYTLRRVVNERSLDFTALRDSLQDQNTYFQDPTILGLFVDNHDQPRFTSLSGDTALLRNVLTYTFFAQGVPIIYYGTEQAFSGGGDPDNRESLWPYYNQNSKMYQFIQAMLTFRKANVDAVTGTAQELNMADADTFVFTKNNNQIVVFVSRVGTGQPASATVSLNVPDGTVYQNILNPGDVITVSDGSLLISIADGEPRVYVMTHNASSIGNTSESLRLGCR